MLRASVPMSSRTRLRSDHAVAPATPRNPAPPAAQSQRLGAAPLRDLRASRLANHDAVAAALTPIAIGMNQPSSVPSTSTVSQPATAARTAPPIGAMNGVAGRHPAIIRTGSAPARLKTAIVTTTASGVVTSGLLVWRA